MKNYLKYSVNVDYDCMIDNGSSIFEARSWFNTEEAKESYEDDWEEAKEIAQKVFEERKFSTLLDDVQEETNNNCHAEALKMIADFFGYPEYSKLFEEYANKDYITTDEFKERYEASERMLIVIEVKCGERVANEIRKVL